MTLRTNVEADSAPAPLGDAAGAESDGPPLPRGVVPHIEDNPTNFMLVEHLLMRWPDVTLLCAETGKDGLMAARAAKLDLILLDMRLPVMDALDALKEVRGNEASPPCRVVALSASAMLDEVDAAEKAGALDYWTNPLDFARLLRDMRGSWQANDGLRRGTRG